MDQGIVHAQLYATQFTDIATGRQTFGFRIHNNFFSYDDTYNNRLTQADTQLSDLDLLDVILQRYNIATVANIMRSIQYYQASMEINGNVYNWNSLVGVFQKYYRNM